MTEITKQDLMELKTEIKNHIDLKLEPITKEINGFKMTLYGPDGRNGIVADVNNLKNSAKWVKGLAGGGLFTGITGWLKEFLK